MLGRKDSTHEEMAAAEEQVAAYKKAAFFAELEREFRQRAPGGLDRQCSRWTKEEP
jgi:hypothetical protein